MLAPAAAAHVPVEPASVPPASTVRLEFTAENEQVSPITGFTLTVPPELELAVPETVAGWRVAVAGRRVSWTGGRIPPRRFAVFSVRVTTPARAQDAVFGAREQLADGRAIDFESTVEVAPEAAAARRDDGARTLGKFALGLAAAALVLAAGAGFLALYTWLRAGDARVR